MSLVVPAVLASSKTDLEAKLALFATFPGLTRVQIDVVDGLFVSPPSWPYTNDIDARDPHIPELPRLHEIAYEIDLMCIDPIKAAEPWVEAGATRVTFHDGSTSDINALIKKARDHFGHFLTIGLALHTDTDLEHIREATEHIDYLQCMGIARIGRQGQPFDPEVIGKIRTCRMRYPSLCVQVDGGVTYEHGKELLAAGASTLVVGSAILKATDPRAAFIAFETLRSPFGV